MNVLLAILSYLFVVYGDSSIGASNGNIERQSLERSSSCDDNCAEQRVASNSYDTGFKESSMRFDRDTSTNDKLNIDTGDRKNWVDPNNMFTYNPSTKSRFIDRGDLKDPEGGSCLGYLDKLKACEESKTANSTSCSRIEFTFLERILKKLINRLEEISVLESFEITLNMKLQKEDIKSILLFLESPCDHIQDVEVSLSRVISESRNADVDNFSSLKLTLQDINMSFIILSCLFLGLVVLSAIGFWRASLFQRMMFCFLILFCWSVIWNWIRLYKDELAKKHSVMAQSNIMDCQKDVELNVISSLALWLKTTFTLTENKCQKYHKAILVDPIWEVTPLMALSETIASFFFHPIGVVGDKLGVFFKNFLLHLPPQYGLLITGLVIVFVLIISLLIVTVLFGYRLKLPLFFGTLEPAFSPPQKTIRSNISGILRGTRIEEIENPHTTKSLQYEERQSDELQDCGCPSCPKEVTEQVHSSSGSWRTSDKCVHGSGEPCHYSEDLKSKQRKRMVKHCPRCAEASLNVCKEDITLKERGRKMIEQCQSCAEANIVKETTNIKKDDAIKEMDDEINLSEAHS